MQLPKRAAWGIRGDAARVIQYASNKDRRPCAELQSTEADEKQRKDRDEKEEQQPSSSLIGQEVRKVVMID